MSGKRIHTIVLGLLLSLALLGTASAVINDGGGTGEGGASCARCAGDGQCAGGYASGGTDCIVQCRWNGKSKEFDRCSCYTTGDCPKDDDGGGTTTRH